MFSHNKLICLSFIENKLLSYKKKLRSFVAQSYALKSFEQILAIHLIFVIESKFCLHIVENLPVKENFN
jgi:hypothetical protein